MFTILRNACSGSRGPGVHDRPDQLFTIAGIRTTQGPLHETALLTWKEAGTTRTLHVPIALRAAVAAWVAEAKRLKQLRHAMSAAQRAFLIALRRQRAP